MVVGAVSGFPPVLAGSVVGVGPGTECCTTTIASLSLSVSLSLSPFGLWGCCGELSSAFVLGVVEVVFLAILLRLVFMVGKITGGGCLVSNENVLQLGSRVRGMGAKAVSYLQG